MRHTVTPALGALALLALMVGPLHAQLDYRNLDDGRPLWTEDAWPVERRALEFVLPYTAAWGRGASLHSSRPELAWGAWDNLMVGAKLPLALVRNPSGDELGVAGPGAFLFYNLRAEGAVLPAFALRAEGHLPWGTLAADKGSATIKAIATRTLGRERVHLNAAWTPVGADAAGGLESEGRWAASVALDRTLFRSSTLIAGELVARDGGEGVGPDFRAAAGLRRQVTPALVLDLGISRALRKDADHPWELTVGFSRSIGVGRGGHASVPGTGQTTRAEWHYLPGSFNWQFLRQYPEAAGLFNAFDYGHAVLYERLWTDPNGAVDALETTEFNFLTQDLLIRPPRFAVAEEVIEPSYARVALEAKRMFEWAHLLHRQIYDVYADTRMSREAQHALVERLTDDYLGRSELAFTDMPKGMELMDEQSFSQYFRQKFPKMNGLIWAYHWLQVGLYEPLMQEPDPASKKAGVAHTLARFWAFADSAPAHFPTVMPMASAVAPTFSAAHPRAAIIFDNLHMMHDIISDILANPAVPRAEKPTVIRAQLAEFRNPETNLMGMEHWHMMADMMGGVELMGGVAGREKK